MDSVFLNTKDLNGGSGGRFFGMAITISISISILHSRLILSYLIIRHFRIERELLSYRLAFVSLYSPCVSVKVGYQEK